MGFRKCFQVTYGKVHGCKNGRNLQCVSPGALSRSSKKGKDAANSEGRWYNARRCGCQYFRMQYDGKIHSIFKFGSIFICKTSDIQIMAIFCVVFLFCTHVEWFFTFRYCFVGTMFHPGCWGAWAGEGNRTGHEVGGPIAWPDSRF